jgi:hypothetical protein
LFSNISTDTIKKDDEITNVIWEIVYYTEKGELLDPTNKDYTLLKNYMPTLGNDNCLIPCNMYLADSGAEDERKLYPVVLCKTNEEDAS